MRMQARIAVTEEEAEKVFNPLGIKSEIRHGISIAHLFVDDARYHMLLDEMKRLGIHFNAEMNPIFEREEMNEGEFFHMVPRAQWGYPEPQDDWKNRSYDSSTACRACGTGAKQIRPFFVAGTPKFGRGDIVAMFWVYEFLITDRLRTILEKAGLSGTEFWPLMGFSGHNQERPVEGCWQLHIVNELPRMSLAMEFPSVRLPRGAHCDCGRIGRNIPREQLRYRRPDLACAKDFNKSNEWLGGGLDTSQLKIVSRRVYDVFARNNVRGVDFEPIIIED